MPNIITQILRIIITVLLLVLLIALLLWALSILGLTLPAMVIKIIYALVAVYTLLMVASIVTPYLR